MTAEAAAGVHGGGGKKMTATCRVSTEILVVLDSLLQCLLIAEVQKYKTRRPVVGKLHVGEQRRISSLGCTVIKMSTALCY